jgi:Leucine-rich repeat (LRR) protein
MDALAASPFAVLDAHGCLRFVTDVVHEDDALCLALACRAMRDALGARCPGPSLPARGWPRAVAWLAARVTADGVLDLSNDDDDGGLRALPEGFGRLAYLLAPGLRMLNLFANPGLTALPEGMCALAGLEELDLAGCGITALPEGVGALTGLLKLDLDGNRELTALPEGLCALAGLAELILRGCGLTALPQGIGRLIGLRTLDLRYNEELTALPAGLGQLGSLVELGIGVCPGLAVEHAIMCSAARYDTQYRCGLPALLAYLRGEVVEGVADLDLAQCGLRALPEGIGALIGLWKLDLSCNDELSTLPEGLCSLAGLAELDLASCGLRALPEGIRALTGLKTLNLSDNERLTALPAGLGRLRNLEELDLGGCPYLDDLYDLYDQPAHLSYSEGLPALLAHLAAQDGEPAAGEAG